MSTTSHPDDRWLLPRRQTEYPARDLLPEATLHARREATFLVLAAIFLVTAVTLVLLGTTRLLDVNALVAQLAPSVELPRTLLVPLGALPFAASFLAASLTCELLGRRRASALIWIGFAAVLALVGLLRIADLIDGGYACGAALGLAACYATAHLTNLLVFDLLRRSSRGPAGFASFLVAALPAQAIGWLAFAVVHSAGDGYVYLPLDHATITALATGSTACGAAITVVLAIPAVLAARGLSIALRVGRDPLGGDDDDEDALAAYRRAYGSEPRRLPPALIVDEYVAAIPSLQPYSSAEMRFFADGDAIS